MRKRGAVHENDSAEIQGVFQQQFFELNILGRLLPVIVSIQDNTRSAAVYGHWVGPRRPQPEG
jgi:hypothetical protein